MMENKKKESDIQNNSLEKNVQDTHHDDVLNKNKQIEELKLQLLDCQNKINDIQLRKLADIENIKKNTEIKVKEIITKQIETFFQKIILIIDSLEEILILSNNLKINNTPLIQGIELTLQSVFKILHKSGIKIVGEENEIFNPEIHEMIGIEKSNNIEPNHIISVEKKGFTLNKVILRKAQVKISNLK